MDLLQSMQTGNARQARSDAVSACRGRRGGRDCRAGRRGHGGGLLCRRSRPRLLDPLGSKRAGRRGSEQANQNRYAHGGSLPSRCTAKTAMRRRCGQTFLKGSSLRWLRVDAQSSACPPIGRRHVMRSPEPVAGVTGDDVCRTAASNCRFGQPTKVFVHRRPSCGADHRDG